MISQSSPLHSPAMAPSGAARRSLAVQGAWKIGALALPPRDATALRALVGWLDGSLGGGLRYSEDIAACDVVFALPSDSAICPGRTTVLVTEAPAVPLGSGSPITVSSPLRMTSVIAALQQALSRGRSSHPADRPPWLSSLFERLQAALRAPGASVLPIGAGQLLQIDAVSRTLRATVPIEQLLSHAHGLGALRPGTAVDDVLLREAPVHALGVFLWRLSAAMVEARVPHPPLRGAWRLLRWPRAAGLTAPGHPQLAALLSRRPYTALELAERTGLPLPTVRAFLVTCDALGLGRLDAAAPPPDGACAAAVAASFRPLRERLRLW